MDVENSFERYQVSKTNKTKEGHPNLMTSFSRQNQEHEEEQL